MEDPAAAAPVWVADDDRAIRWVLNRALGKAGIPCRLFASGDDALAALQSACAESDPQALPLVLVSDIRMPGLSGMALLERVKRLAPDLPVIIMTAFSDLENAVKSIQGGAFEYLPKPFDVERAVALIQRAAAEAQRRREALFSPSAESDGAAARGNEAPLQRAAKAADAVPIPLIGQAPAMQEVFRAIGRLSQSSVTVLLTGESGVGKEVVARAVWSHSKRRGKPFIAINMAAIPKELLESELFGHEKGAFTGASATRFGRFEQAAGGTLFLDEIGDMPMELQTRLLRVLSNGSFYRVGGREPIAVDVRVIAATNQDLEAAVKEGRFREDLYHRLNVIRLRLPPLRERREDIEPLARHFLAKEAQALGLPPKVLTREALNALEAFPFPGNVRQLENVCRWLLVMAPTEEVRREDLPPEILQASSEAIVPAAAAAPAEAAVDAGRPLVQSTTLPAASAMPAGAASSDWRIGLAQEVAARLARQGADGETPAASADPQSGASLSEGLPDSLWAQLTAQFERTVLDAALQVTKGRKGEAAVRLGLGRNTLTRKLQVLEGK